MDPKQLAAAKAVSLVRPGMLVGLGTGSTASWAIRLLGIQVKNGLGIKAIASSLASEELARHCGITLADYGSSERPDITIDGADEVDSKGNLIKGGGGALLREKILAWNASTFVVIVDGSKHVPFLGNHPVPVEIISFALELTLKNLEKLGCQSQLRKEKGRLFTTDNGHLIADCQWPSIPEPVQLDQQIRAIPGVMETGIFPASMVHRIITGYEDGRVEEGLRP